MRAVSKSCKSLCLFAISLYVLPCVGLAESGLDTGDTAWVLTSTALVLFMTIPGLSLFYACRPGAQQECVIGTDAVFCDHLPDFNFMVGIRLQPCLQ